MAASELIEWRVLAEKYIAVGLPIEQPVLADPDLRLVFDPQPERLGLRLRISGDRLPPQTSALRNITVRAVLISGFRYVEVLTDSPELFRAIYALINDVVVRINDGQKDGLRALEASLSAFQALVAQVTQLSRERAVGLLGEMIVLEQLLLAGVCDEKCWIGADKECHDFRLERHELEVKTTTTNVREHVIHGLNQLSPSPDHSLSLVSIRLGNPGGSGGRSLNDLIDAIRLQLQAHAGCTKFDRMLLVAGYDPTHFECSVRYQLNAAIADVPIERDFPAVSYSWLAKTLGAEPAGRIRDVNLTLNVEGLGTPFDATNYLGQNA